METNIRETSEETRITTHIIGHSQTRGTQTQEGIESFERLIS